MNGTRLFVHREGEGVPVVVVHGGPVLDHSYLRPYLAPLADGRELVYYDQRLSGRSDGRVDSASVRLASFVADLEGVRAGLDLGPVHVLAHSWGGLLALSYALAHPERVRSLVLVSPMPPSFALWQEEQAAQAAHLSAADTAGGGALRSAPGFQDREPAAVEAVLKHSFRGALYRPEMAERLSFHIEPDYAERSRQFGYLMPDLLAFDLVERLRGLQVPVLLVYGADEPWATRGGDVLMEVLPRARRVTLDEAGHFAFMEVPGAFTSEVRAFLSEVERSGR